MRSVRAEILLLIVGQPPNSTLFPYTTLFRSRQKSRRPRQKRFSIARVRRRARRLRRRLRIRRERGEEKQQHGNRSSASLHRSEEHTSELQSRRDIVCRLLLEKKKSAHPCDTA